jgi:hypothetical protein
MGATLVQTPRIGYRPVAPWQVKAAEAFRVQPATIRDWMETLRKRVAQLLAVMVRWGARDLAEQWLLDFELALLTATEETETDVLRQVSEADAGENVKRDAYLLSKSPDDRRAFILAERKEIAVKLRGLRVLEGMVA